MNTGQTLLAVGAVMLIGFIVLRNNNIILSFDEALTRSKIKVIMTVYAQTIIKQASSKHPVSGGFNLVSYLKLAKKFRD